MTTLEVPGLEDPRPGPSSLAGGLPAGCVRVKRSVLVHAARAADVPVRVDGLSADDVVELEFRDGFRLWMRVEDIPADLSRSGAGRGGDGTVRLPTSLTVGPASRAGAGAWAIKAMKVLGIDIEGEITDFVAEYVERRLDPGPGLHRCSEDPARPLSPSRKLGGTSPVLVFLHGTASSTQGSFGDLWAGGGSARMRSLIAQYGGRVLGFQHRTLTESPLQNAADLMERLSRLVDPGAELHLVSHSRGGLVGEVIARGMVEGAAPFTPDELALFADGGRDADRKALATLNERLPAARYRITRFVRVACPARGTTLADGRLDRYVSVLVNLAGMVPGLRANPVYDGLTSLLAGVLRKRTDPAELPGLEAMMPTSPLVRVLNRPGVRTRADLHVIGGDIAPSGVWGRLKALATDFYYRDDHDLVVNTPAMLGGIERDRPIRYWIDTGGDVTHFNYFSRADTAGRLVAALGGTSGDFRTLEAKPSVVTSADYVKRAAGAQPVAVVLAGIMGSQLSVGDDAVWVNLLALSRGGLSALDMAAPRVRATGLLRSGYAALCGHLAQSHHVVECPYDWRQPLDVSAEELVGRLGAILAAAEAARQPVRLIAHSMGGLVVRAMLATREGQDTWSRMCRHPGARLVMLGTPNGGSHAIAAMLMGRDALVRKLALLDLANDHRALLGTIAGFEGVLDLLPEPGTEAGALDLYDRATWERLLENDAPVRRGLGKSDVATDRSAAVRWTVPASASLARARKLARAVRNVRFDPARVVYVAGVADQTPCAIEIDEAAPEGRRVRVKATSRGDGRVPWDTGIPEGVRAYFMDTAHGDLASDRRFLPALSDLISTGHTAKLATSPPARRDALELFDFRDPVPDMVPDEDELTAAALGAHPHAVDDPRPEGAPVRVRVVHDNLTNARHAVLVGHYQDDVIVAAEAYLDRRLKGRLAELLRMGLYPGALGTAVVVANDAPPGDLSAHPGAVVAGLGTVGEVTPGRLANTLAQAMTTYGADFVGRERRRRQREGRGGDAAGTLSAPLATLLVGSGEGGLALQDVVQALVRAVAIANRRLRQGDAAEAGHVPPRLIARIDQLDIVELYEDRAIDAVHALRGLARSSEFKGMLFEELLAPGSEGQRRAWYSTDRSWWQRLRITTEADDTLRFEAVTDAARARASLRPTQRHLVEAFVSQALGTTEASQDLGCTLFELLLPNDFKAYAPDRRKLAILMDTKSAALPWELLQDRFDPEAEPLSVACGMVRQLLGGTNRSRLLHSSEATALVVGNPPVLDRRFPPLPGASEEARAVAEQLDRSGFRVVSLTDAEATSQSVFTELHRRPWRVLHLAAHGVHEFRFDEDSDSTSGLVLDDGLVLTPAEAAQMRFVPDLVFINCCHLGRTDAEDRRRRFPALAANLATEFIWAGARAVVAAGWAVDDAAAKTFATAFYREMLGGSLFGDAVWMARRETYRQHGGTNTWGAYQCYGDPSFSLGAGGARRADGDTAVAEAELRCAFENVASSARQNDASERSLAAWLDELVGQAPAAWWESAALCASAGRAFAELGEFAKALDYFRRLPEAGTARFPLDALEQYANCLVRHAAALMAEDGARRRAEAESSLDQAETKIDLLLKIGVTSERLAIKASAMKQRALFHVGDKKRRVAALAEVSRIYGHALSLSDAAEWQAYALANKVAADILRQWEAGARPPARLDEVRRQLKRLASLADELYAVKTDVFSLSARADAELLRALAQAQLTPAHVETVADALRQAMSRGATRRQRESILRMLAFLGTMAAVSAPGQRRSELVRGLTELERAVRS